MYGGDPMKLVTYLDGHLRVGVVVDSGVVDLSERFDSMLALIEEGEPALEEVRSLAEKTNPLAAEVELRAPIPHPRRTSFVWGGTT
jgi:2,4-didehydro-3-deoxy-L-rhamnonate hydrolase